MRLLASLLNFLAIGAVAALAATPVFDDPLKEGTLTKVLPVVPTGKVLLFPVSAYDDAEQLTITATSANPKVFVRVKTGNPLMKFVITHAAGASGDPAYTDTAVFQLFRDLAPETVGYVGGFAQSGFYDSGSSNKIFRIADFGAVGGQVDHSFIFQGGSNTGTSSGNLGFNFDNELNQSAMFTGAGQIAMANGGYDTFKRGTNGSQYFMTDGNVRFLDFKHTIFGQLTHGFSALKKLHATAPATATGDGAPAVPITVSSSSIIPQYVVNGHTYTDAVLVITATAPGTSLITITAANAQGLKGTQTFTVTALDDTRDNNDRPFVTPISDSVIAASGQANLGFRIVDLEHDYVPATATLASNGSTTNANGFTGLLGTEVDLFGINTSFLSFHNQGIIGVIGNPTFITTTGSFSIGRYTGPLFPTVSITQFEPTFRSGIDGAARAEDNATGSNVAVGDSGLATETTVLSGAPATAPAPSYVVARYRDTDAHGQASDITAKINWGDGTALSTGSIGVDPTRPSATGYQITGAHSYARAGTYSVVTTLTSAKGLRQLVRSTAVISASPLKAVGLGVVLPGPTIANSVIATFTDSSTTTTPAAGYVATVDWGDGTVAAGTVRAAGPGKFSVIGKHTYKDSERYSLSVRVHRAGSAADQDSVAWSSIVLSKAFGVQHLPPFNCAHLVAGVLAVPVSQTTLDSPAKPTKLTVGTGTAKSTLFNYSVQIVNSGNLASKAGKMRFYLSLDNTVNLTAIGTNPADVPLKIKALNTNEFFLPAMQPGQSIKYYFQKTPYADYSLVPPAGETGTGYNMLVQLDYHDPLADHLPIDKVAVAGKISGILVDKTFLATRESGTTDSFKVSLDKAPTADVMVPITIGSTGTTEGSVDKTSLTFTSTNWNVQQTVTVTGLKDTPTTTTGTTTGRDGSKTYSIATGFSTSTDPFFNGMLGPQVTVSNADRDGNLILSSTTTAYTTTESATNNTRNISFTIARKPTSPVMITIASSDITEGKIVVVGGTDDSSDPNKKILTIPVPMATDTVPFTKTFTIQSVDDHIRDGNQTYTVSFVVQSNDKEFDGLTLPALTITNTDDGTVAP